jgi:hypothetical protein
MSHAHHALSLRRRISLALHRWHRRIGVCASLFVIWMVVSGWLLNHTAALDLGRRLVHSTALARHYGLQSGMPRFVFAVGAHWLAQTPQALFLDGKKIDAALNQLLGMASAHDVLFVADNSQLLLLDAQGGLIDKLSGSALPLPRIERIGAGCAGIVIADAEKSFSTADGISWAECGENPRWSAARPISETQQQILAAIVEPGISLERVLLDLHSGRILGAWGPYFIDLVGLGLIALALSGLWMYAQQARRQRRHSRH